MEHLKEESKNTDWVSEFHKQLDFYQYDNDMLLETNEYTKVLVVKNSFTQCYLEIGIGKDKDDKWATIYRAENLGEQGKGHMSDMFRWFAEFHRKKGFTSIGCTIALKPQIRHLCEKYNIEEYK